MVFDMENAQGGKGANAFKFTVLIWSISHIS